MIRSIGGVTVAALLVSSIAAAGTATAQPSRASGAYGPVVLRADPATGLPMASRHSEEVRLDRAVPVPSVMNGGGFGLSGTDYYSDGLHEGRLRKGVRRNDYVLAPALRSPPRQ